MNAHQHLESEAQHKLYVIDFWFLTILPDCVADYFKYSQMNEKKQSPAENPLKKLTAQFWQFERKGKSELFSIYSISNTFLIMTFVFVRKHDILRKNLNSNSRVRASGR